MSKRKYDVRAKKLGIIKYQGNYIAEKEQDKLSKANPLAQ